MSGVICVRLAGVGGMAVRGWLGLAAAAALSACAGPRQPTSAGASHAAVMECAPYARQVSGIQLYGDAADWWEQAAGRYARSDRPEPGAVLVFRRSARLPHGHVSVVLGLRSGREITVTQANWVHGRVAHGEPVVDVSPANDWTLVRVWWAPAGVLGTTPYATFGFVTRAPAGRAPAGRAPEPEPARLLTSDASPAATSAGVLCPASDTNGG